MRAVSLLLLAILLCACSSPTAAPVSGAGPCPTCAPPPTCPPAAEARALPTAAPLPTYTLYPTYTPPPAPSPAPPTAVSVKPSATPKQAAGKLGTTVEEGGYSLSGVAIEEPAKPGSFYKAEAGKKLVGIEVIVGNVSGDEIKTNPLNASLVDADGFNYKPELGGLAKGQLAMVTLKPGDKVRGWIGFAIPEKAIPAGIKYNMTGFSGPEIQAPLSK